MVGVSEDSQIQDVKVYISGTFLGNLSVAMETGTPGSNLNWEGQILGSDYLVWGLHHKKVNLHFKDGSQFDAIIRPGGKVVRATRS